MEGGYILGQGTYGCVFDPPLLCEDSLKRRRDEKKRAGVLGKLTELRDYKVEEEATNHIRTIPNFERYFLPIDTESACKPKALDAQKDTDIWKCDYLRREGYDLGPMIHYTMKYGGVDAYSLLCNPKSDEECKAPGPFKNWRNFFEHMLEIGAAMALYGFVHYDIHRTNILVDPKTALPKLIDFGQAFSTDSITKKTLEDRWKRIQPDRPVGATEPPEVMVITYMKKGFTAPQAFGQMLRHKAPIAKVESILGLSRQAQGRDFVEFWRQSGIVRSNDWVSLFKVYWPGFDAWAIGAVLLNLLEYAQMTTVIASTEEFKETRPKMKEVLRGMLRLNPKRRLDCVEALNLWNSENELILSERGQQWLETRERQRAGAS